MHLIRGCQCLPLLSELTVVHGHDQVIKANDDLTPEHHQFFLYQMLRGLKYIHTGTLHMCQTDLHTVITMASTRLYS